MGIADIAINILKKRNKLLHYSEITELILKEHILKGKTPSQSVRSALGKDKRFKRVAEGVYALIEWDDYKAVRFAKDIAFEILEEAGNPISIDELAKRISHERSLKSAPITLIKSIIKTDNRFYFDREKRILGLCKWKGVEK